MKEVSLLIGVLSGIAPIIAAYLRGRSRFLLMATGLSALAFSVYLVVVMRLVQIGPQEAALPYVYALMATGVPVLLAGYLVSVGVGRDRPEEAFRHHRWAFILLGAAGLVFIAMIRHSSLVNGYEWEGGTATIFLGAVGKAYLSYLLMGIVFIGYNLESTYRLAPSNVRHHLRLLFLAFFGLLGFFTFIITTGILYSSLGLGKMVSSGLPIAFANGLIAYGFLRGALTDVAAPVSRKIVYSSFTAFAAGIYVLAVGVVAQLATFTHWSPDEVVSLSFGFLAALIAILLLFSNRFQRRVRRFIDRNFYVNRYDYRSQWSSVTRSLDEAQSGEETLQVAASMLREIFLAGEVTIAVRDQASHTIRACVGKGAGHSDVVLEDDSPLPGRLLVERCSLLLDRRADDFEYIPIYAENRQWLENTASQIVAPLFDKDELVGTIGLERHHKDDPFTFEDTALLDSISTHIAAALRSVQLAEELADSREMELLSQWSSMLLHDFKNYLTPLRMIAQNMSTYRDREDVVEISARDISQVADRMESLVRTLSELRQKPDLYRTEIDPNELVRSTLSGIGLDRHRRIEVQLDLQATTPVLGDRTMLRRVLENLVTNAVEAMNGAGTLTLRTADRNSNGATSGVVLTVRDTGTGISEDFLRERIFRPFATTKKKGLGLGLYQCRSIIRAHGGTLSIESQPGRGSTFQITLTSPPGERSPSEQVTVQSGAAP